MAHTSDNGSDSRQTQESLNFYSTETEEKPGDDPGSSRETETVTENEEGSSPKKKARRAARAAGAGSDSEAVDNGSEKHGHSEGLLGKAKRAVFGDKGPGEKAKGALTGFFTSGGGASKVITKLAAPKALAAITLGSGLGFFSIFGIFSTYKNDDIVKNDPPLQCEQGELDLPSMGGGSDNDIQENVNIMYDIFCNQFGYSEEFLVGMLSCMKVESDINPDRLESDYMLGGAKEAFDAVAGPEMPTDTATALSAYYTYGSAFQSGGGWNGNPAYLVDGNMCCGIGLIQWTGDRGIKLLEGLDKVSMDVSPMDLHYQCAFLLAEFKTSFQACAPDGGWQSQCGSDVAATQFFFETVVSGGSTTGIDLRLNNVDECRGYVNAAAANSEFTADTVTMAEILADDSFTSAVAQSSGIQLCKNKTFIDNSDIAKAAVSISWIERGDYEDVHGAYGEYRRSARSPLLINNWDFVDGFDNNGSDQPKIDGTYATHGVPADNPKATLKYYKGGNNGGKQDLIACTEYYYFAHLIAFPKETGKGGNAGYFSSCDRGTGTAVRIAGADDKFPAGNPLAQLAWACGAKKQGAHHNTDDRGSQGAGFLWQFAGFMRGCDYYSASGGSEIAPGTVMISWSEKAANGYLSGAGSGATDTADGNDTGAIGDATGEDVELDEDEEGTDAKMKEANLRWPFSISNTTRHIITFVGEGTVNDFWGIEWLMKQWTLFDDSDRLIRGDLTVQVPEIMKRGSQYKSSTGGKATDQKMTFYKANAKGAQDHTDIKQDAISGRYVEFNSKTGLPEFKAWEQIFVRLVHNSDDDAAAQKVSEEGELYVKFETEEDNYLDDAEQEDLIEQYQKQDTYANKYFYEDWNSIGAGKHDDDSETNDYKTDLPIGELLYYDDWSDPWTHDSLAPSSPYWRYILITDIEYRMNQLMRFGMASFMCSVASEEDADVVQTGADQSNVAGHILGNLYRRYSRIDDDIDVSGRYYYYNTVVSNDMLQDLVQLYSMDRNAKDQEEKEFRNYGPMNLLGSAYANSGWAYDSNTKEAGTLMKNWIDRRYGLTMTDVKNIMEGLGGMTMGMAEKDAINTKLAGFMNVGLHKLSETELALYDREHKASEEHDGKKSHEGEHKFASGYYASELYGVNPFLMLESHDNLDYVEDLTAEEPDHSAESDLTKGVRNSMAGFDGVSGIDGDNPKMDDRLAWIDRHYYVTNSGAIGTYAYMVLGLNPSTGKQVDGSLSDYVNALKATKTLEATGTYGSADKDNLKGSRGVVRYTDYIYGEDEENNLKMGKRLYNDDKRTSTSDVRDDYNRREWYVMPYYHTHMALCDHDHGNMLEYDVDGNPAHDSKAHMHEEPRWRPNCVNWDYSDTTGDAADVKMIDTIWKLNKQNKDSNVDVGDTISFDPNYSDNRMKYDIMTLISDRKVKYFAYWNGGVDETASYTWQEITPSADACTSGNTHPPGHVHCTGAKFEVTCSKHLPSACTTEGLLHGHCSDCSDTWPCGNCEAPCPWCPDGSQIIVKCDGTNEHSHPCHECITNQPKKDHGHQECEVGVDCHDLYGCNILEYLYHNGIPVYMAISTVPDPKEDMSLGRFTSEYTSGGTCYPDKGNLMQQITYDQTSGFINISYQDQVNPGHEGALVNPQTDGIYMDSIQCLSLWLGEELESEADYTYTTEIDNKAGGITVGYQSDGDRGLLGYFSIEGNLIRDAMGETKSEEIKNPDKNCAAPDLQRLEAIKIRVGYGKFPSGDSQKVNKTAYAFIRQGMKGTRDGGSGLEDIEYETLKPDAHTDVDAYLGYGETTIVGSQHLKNPMPDAGYYADGEVHGSGPDGSQGNKSGMHKNSLLREILGDEHVVHVTFGSQDAGGLMDKDKDNGRDFMLYIDDKKWNKKIDNDLGEDYEGEERDPSWYMQPGQMYDGREVIPELTDDMTPAERRMKYNQSWAKTMSPFVDMDGDARYLDPNTGEPTTMKYFDNIEREPTDEKVDANGYPNKKLVELRSTGSGDGIKSNEEQGVLYDGAVNGSDSRGSGIDKDGEATTNNGDYRLWVTHASRGTRGMMTQYLNFKSFFKYVHNSVPASGEYAYMLFTNVKRQDNADGSQDADHDNDKNEDFVYEDAPSDAVLSSDYLRKHGQVWGSGSVEIKDGDNVIGYKPEKFTDGYGQGANSHWKNLIDVYNAAMSETRQFGK